MITGRVIATTEEKFEAKCLQLSFIGMEHTQSSIPDGGVYNEDHMCYENNIVIADLADGL